MSYELLEHQIRLLPEEALEEVASFVTYMQYKFNVNGGGDMVAFRNSMEESRKWASDVGMTEQDIRNAIKDVRMGVRS